MKSGMEIEELGRLEGFCRAFAEVLMGSGIDTGQKRWISSADLSSEGSQRGIMVLHRRAQKRCIFGVYVEVNTGRQWIKREEYGADAVLLACFHQAYLVHHAASVQEFGTSFAAP
jgi:hypothetical protein